MRSAEEILLSNIPRLPSYVKPNLIKAINEARIESIEECAEKAYQLAQKETSPAYTENQILNLINELK